MIENKIYKPKDYIFVFVTISVAIFALCYFTVDIFTRQTAIIDGGEIICKSKCNSQNQTYIGTNGLFPLDTYDGYFECFCNNKNIKKIYYINSSIKAIKQNVRK